MCCAWNARIIIPNRLFALPREFICREINIFRNEREQIVFYLFLVLWCWGNNFRFLYYSVCIHPVFVIENSSRRFCAAVTGSFARLNINKWFFRHLKLLDYPQRFLTSIKSFNCAHRNTFEWVVARWQHVNFFCQFFYRIGKLIEVEIITRQRSNKIYFVIAFCWLQCIGMPDMFFMKILFVFIYVSGIRTGLRIRCIETSGRISFQRREISFKQRIEHYRKRIWKLFPRRTCSAFQRTAIDKEQWRNIFCWTSSAL